MSKRKLSREEAIESFEERCRCESRQPETEEENQRKFKEFFEKVHGDTFKK